MCVSELALWLDKIRETNIFFPDATIENARCDYDINSICAAVVSEDGLELEPGSNEMELLLPRPAASGSQTDGSAVHEDVGELCELIAEWTCNGTSVHSQQPRFLPVIQSAQSTAYFRETLRRTKEDTLARQWILRDWYAIRDVEQALSWRRTALRKVGAALVQSQPEFFRYGETRGYGSLRYLTRHELGRRIGWDASIVGRAVKRKWIKLPWGQSVRLESLFNHRRCSRREVQQRLIELIREEAGLGYCSSDDELSRLLLQQYGLNVPRRTVRDLRHALGIGSTRDRGSVSER